MTYLNEFIEAVTGWGFDMAECIRAGERIERICAVEPNFLTRHASDYY